MSDFPAPRSRSAGLRCVAPLAGRNALAGLAIGLAWNVRQAYIATLVVILLVVVARAGIRRAPVRAAGVVALVLAGIVVASLPQMLINHRHGYGWNPTVPDAKRISLENLYGGLINQRYETSNDPDYPSASVRYLDPSTQAIIEEEQLGTVGSRATATTQRSSPGTRWKCSEPTHGACSTGSRALRDAVRAGSRRDVALVLAARVHPALHRGREAPRTRVPAAARRSPVAGGGRGGQRDPAVDPTRRGDALLPAGPARRVRDRRVRAGHAPRMVQDRTAWTDHTLALSYPAFLLICFMLSTSAIALIQFKSA